MFYNVYIMPNNAIKIVKLLNTDIPINVCIIVLQDEQSLMQFNAINIK